MPPRSRICSVGQPKLSRSRATWAFAPSSSPTRKTSWRPGTRPGSTMTLAVIVLSAFTTFVPGSSRWICSARLSSFATDSRGGNPPEKSSGLDTSTRVLPSRLPDPAARSASSEATPAVALTMSSPCAAASAKLPSAAAPPELSTWATHATALSLPALRDPITTSWPSWTSLVASVWPTVPVPRTPMRMTCSVSHHQTFDGVSLHQRRQLVHDPAVQVAEQPRGQGLREPRRDLDLVRPEVGVGADDPDHEHRSRNGRAVGRASVNRQAGPDRHVPLLRRPLLAEGLVALRGVGFREHPEGEPAPVVPLGPGSNLERAHVRRHVHRRQVERQAGEALLVSLHPRHLEVAVPRLVQRPGQRHVEGHLEDPVVRTEDRLGQRRHDRVGHQVDESAEPLGMHREVVPVGAAVHGATRTADGFVEEDFTVLLELCGPGARKGAGDPGDAVAVERV